ncbi:hypothetical protein U0035_08870 [Niabella yanshanensis]|uniref:Uncharacterized protein n=1 Tax=Niabella yanshanensis TaxID=577386 RepID=A0ABZ0WBD5_9BACT|nr:hypothetical protein [Niabella yanshanensis]WQD40254.1 hypothetical protein U0035_08870 [Niabella yanshanensis]
MLEPISIDLNKADLKKDLSAMEKDQKMIDLPIFRSLKVQVEQRISDYPEVIIEDIKFQEGMHPEQSGIVTAVVSFKSNN